MRKMLFSVGLLGFFCSQAGMAMPMERGLELLAVDSLVLAVRQRGTWKAVEDYKFAKGKAGLSFTPVTLDGVGKSFGPVGLQGDTVPVGCYIDSEHVPSAVNVCGFRPSVPRKARIVKDTSRYLAAVSKHLRLAGFGKAKARIARVIEVDLDGDGRREILIEARNRDDLNKAIPHFTPLDYSLVLLGGIHGGRLTWQRVQLVGSTYCQAERLDVKAVLDLDGDGRMEVVIQGDGYEWSDGTILAFRGGKMTRLVQSWGGV